MATQGIRTQFHVRIIHPVTGAVVVDPLYHLGDSTFTKLALQPGFEASATIGSFTLNLYPPASTRYKMYKADYDQLVYGQRVEFYAISSDGLGAQGDPAFVGTINSISYAYDALTITGNDVLGLALEEHTELNEHFAGTTDQLLLYSLKAYTLAFGDGDTAPSPWGAGYSTADGWINVIDQALNCVQAGSSGDGNLISVFSGTNAQYAQCVVAASYRLVCDGAASATAAAGVIAAAADSSNFIMGWAKMRRTAANIYTCDFEIYSKTTGSYTLRSSVQSVLIPVDAPSMRLDLRLLGQQINSTTYLWRLVVNDTDVDCIYQYTVTAGQPTGKVGLHSLSTGTYANQQAYVDQLVFMPRTAIFQPGVVQAGGVTLAQAMAYAAPLTLMETAITAEDYYMRMTYKAGNFSDVVDFGRIPIGIPNPTVALSISAGSGLPLGFGLGPGVYQVYYSWITSSGESLVGPISNSATAIGGTAIQYVSWSNLTTPVPAAVTSVRFYLAGDATGQIEIPVTNHTIVPAGQIPPANLNQLSGKGLPTTFIGNDLTSTVHFKVPLNLLNPKLEPNDQYFATYLTMQGHAAPDGQGSHHRVHIATAQQSGLKHKVVQAANISARTALVKAANASLKRSSRSIAGAKTMTVVRDPQYASVSSPTGMLFRELDSILITAPELYLNASPALIMGYTMRENDPTMDLILDQHPFGTLGALRRNMMSGGTAF